MAPSTSALPETAPAPGLEGTLDAASREKLAGALKLISTEDYSGAATEARKVTISDPKAPEGWYVLGVALSSLGQSEEAIAALDQATALYTANAEPLVVKGDILLSLNRRDEAEAAWTAAADRDPANWRAQERLAALDESRGDRAGALARYEQSIAEGTPGRLYPRLQAARLSLILGDPARTETLLAAAAQNPEAEDQVLDYLARAKIGLDKIDEASALYDQLIQRGTYVRAYVSRAKLYLSAGDVPDAEAVLNKAATAFPGEPLVMLEQGKLLGATGRYDAALERFKAGLAIAPDNATLLRSASLAEMRLGQTEAALTYARKLAEPPAASEDLVWLGSLLELSGDPTGAEKAYRDALAGDQKNWLALNNLSALVVDRDPQQALSLARQAVALAPDVAAVRDTEAWALYKSGDAAAASQIYASLAAAAPEDAVTLYRLGVVQIANGQDADGRASVKAALDADPDFKYADEARAILGLD